MREPTTALDAANCTTLMNDPTLPGVFIPGGPFAATPCASGARLGLTGILTGE